MNPMVWTTVAGDLATGWRHSAAGTIVQTVKGATDLRMLTGPRLLPIRCRLFRQVRVPVARVPVAAHDHGEGVSCLLLLRPQRPPGLRRFSVR